MRLKTTPTPALRMSSVKNEHQPTEQQPVHNTPMNDVMTYIRLAFEHMAQAERLCKMGQQGDADTLYSESQRATDALPDSPITRLLRADIRTMRAQNCIASGYGNLAADLFQDAQLLYDSGNLPIMRINAAVARFYRAQCFLGQGCLEPAAKLLAESQTILASMGDNQRAHLERLRVAAVPADMLADAGRRQAAEEVFAQVQTGLNLLPASEVPRECYVIPIFNRANNLREMGRHEEALTLLEQAEALQQEMPESARSAAIGRNIRESQSGVLSSLGRYDESEQLLAGVYAALEALPDCPANTLEKASVHLNRAVNFRALGLHRQAEDLFGEVDALVAAAPFEKKEGLHRAMQLTNRAENLLELGLPAQALEYAVQLRQTVDLTEETLTQRILNVRSHRTLGLCLRQLGRWGEADTVYAQGSTLCEQLPESHLAALERAQLWQALAIRQAEKGEYEEATRLLDAASGRLSQASWCRRHAAEAPRKTCDGYSQQHRDQKQGVPSSATQSALRLFNVIAAILSQGLLHTRPEFLTGRKLQVLPCLLGHRVKVEMSQRVGDDASDGSSDHGRAHRAEAGKTLQKF